jgi:hypothetical protein
MVDRFTADDFAAVCITARAGDGNSRLGGGN